jgi:hypothetical protein
VNSHTHRESTDSYAVRRSIRRPNTLSFLLPSALLRL